jgi:transcriptional regulator with XRE-family HTH domain
MNISEMNTKKIKAIFDEKKRNGKSREFTYQSVAEKMNQQFERTGVKERVSEQQLKYIVNGQTDLDVAKGLALATVLGCSFVDFLPDEIKELASFESELIFDSPADMNDYFFQHDKSGRTVIFSHFPTYIYLSPLDKFITDCSNAEKTVHNKRIKYLKSTLSYTVEYYEIQTVLNFIFSPFYSNFNKNDKLIIIENYLSMFSLDSRKNKLYFFSTNLRYKPFSTYHLNHSKQIVTMSTPLGNNCFLRIKNKTFFEKVINFLETNKDMTLLNPEKSVYLLQRLKQLLISHEKLDYQAIIDFYEESDEELKNMIYGNLKHLLK